MNNVLTRPPVAQSTLPPDLSLLEQQIFDKGEKAKLEQKLNTKLASGIEARRLFIETYNNPETVKENTKIISEAMSLEDLIERVEEKKINLISRNAISGSFNIYANDYILEQLNFINKYLGPGLTESSAALLSEAKLRAKSLTRACGLRYKVRDLLLGVK